MDPLALLFSWSGRLAPRPFAIAIIAVYLVSFFSQVLLGAPVTGRSGLWPFTLLQAALVWAWLVLHVKRLRDAGTIARSRHSASPASTSSRWLCCCLS